MTNSFDYSKPEAQRIPKRGREDGEPFVSSLSSVGGGKKISKAYTKPEGEREPFLVIIISGGEKREIDYFSALEKEGGNFKRVKLVTLSSKKRAGGLTPQAMYGFALNSIQRGYFEKKETQYSYSEQDVIYLVTDVDHFSKELGRIIYLCKYWKMNIIVSNPCFEIWLYYAYFNSPSEDLSAIASLPLLKRSSALKHRLGELKDGGVDPRKAFENINQCTKNAKKHYEEELSGIPKLYGTRMFVLAEDLQTKLGRELDEWKKSQQERIALYKKGL